MNRSEMEAVIAGGGSVLYGGRILSKKEHLPTHEQLGEKDPTLATASREDLEAKRRAIEEQLRALDRKADDEPGMESPAPTPEGFESADAGVPRGTPTDPTDGKASTPSPTTDAFKAPVATAPAPAPAIKPVEKKK